MPPSKARPVWERSVQLELCLASTGGSLSKAEAVAARINQVYCSRNFMSGVAMAVIVVMVVVVVVVVVVLVVGTLLLVLVGVVGVVMVVVGVGEGWC